MRKIIFLLSLTLLVGCTSSPPITGFSGPPPGQGPGPVHPGGGMYGGTIANLGIAGAKALFIAGKSGNSPYRIASLEQSSLYRANPDGSITPVQATDASGAQVGLFNPRYIARLNDSYLYLITSYGHHLVRISDGKSALVSSGGWYDYRDDDRQVAAADAHGNIFFVNDGVLSKVTPGELQPEDGSETLVKQALNNKEYERVADRLVVDAAGNVIVSVYNSGGGGYGAMRMYKAAGGVQNLATMASEAWLGTNGKFYMARYDYDYSTYQNTSAVERITVSPTGEVTRDVLAGCPMPSRPVNMADRTVSMADGMATLLFIQDLDYETVKLNKLKRVTRLYASATKVYALGVGANDETLVVCYDPATRTESIAFQHTGYQIFKVGLSSNDELTLSVLRFTDGSYGVGTVNSGDLVFLNGTIPTVQEILPLQ